MLQRNYGKLIDACDEVVRFNDFKIKGFERHVGTKMTIWARNTCKDEFVLDGTFSIKSWLIQHTRFINPAVYDPDILLKFPRRTEIPSEIHDEICGFTGCDNLNTSTGIQAIAFYAKTGNEILICGFDSFTPPRRYFDPPADRYMPHSTNESLYIQHLIGQGLIKRFEDVML